MVAVPGNNAGGGVFFGECDQIASRWDGVVENRRISHPGGLNGDFFKSSQGLRHRRHDAGDNDLPHLFGFDLTRKTAGLKDRR